MNRRNFIYLLPALLAIVCLALPSTHAQIMAQVSDNTCTVWNGTECTGYSGQGCNTTTFTLTSTTTVQLCVSLVCDNGQNCPYCLSEAYICPTTGSTCNTCIHSQCDARCSPSCQNVTLSAGSYTLYSCKLDCGDDDCVNCPTSCTATATVYSFPEP
jgi:hypothetical protein